jgi:tRNA (guanine37-N1)-methyltransferase
MKFDILTLFPELVDSILSSSIIGRARTAGLLSVKAHQIRLFAENKHNNVDDTPYGGGAGMVMAAPPIYRCYRALIEDCPPSERRRVIYLSPKGRIFTQSDAERLAGYDRLVLLCGHYEGVDQRVIDLFIDEEISIGDYVLTGGELPAMVLSDAVCRYIDGVLSAESLVNESFSDNLLEYPQYTRPQVFMGLEVPEVLLNGNHKLINEWRREQSIKLTKKLRPDIIKDNPDL